MPRVKLEKTSMPQQNVMYEKIFQVIKQTFYAKNFHN
jgi:hypothetical protein